MENKTSKTAIVVRNSTKKPERKPRGKNKKTIVKEALGLDNLDSLKPEVFEVWKKLLKHKNIAHRKFAVREISKYTYPQKREHSGEVKVSYEDLLAQIKMRRVK